MMLTTNFYITHPTEQWFLGFLFASICNVELHKLTNFCLPVKFPFSFCIIVSFLEAVAHHSYQYVHQKNYSSKMIQTDNNSTGLKNNKANKFSKKQQLPEIVWRPQTILSALPMQKHKAIGAIYVRWITFVCFAILENVDITREE